MGSTTVSLVDIAIWNEYGTQTAPPRPAFRMGIEWAIKENKKYIDAYLQNLFAMKMQKNIDPKQFERLEYNILKRIAQSAVKKIKEIITDGSTVPNAPATIKKKGFDHPLYHTGTLLKNVNYSIEGEK